MINEFNIYVNVYGNIWSKNGFDLRKLQLLLCIDCIVRFIESLNNISTVASIDRLNSMEYGQI